MFKNVYEIATIVFLLQGALLVPLIVWTGVIAFGQMSRLSTLEKAVGRDRSRRDRTLAALLQALPHLQPLNCTACGAALALEEKATTCTSCRATAKVPKDYAATAALRRGLKRLSRTAARYWVAARILVSRPARIFFTVMIFAQVPMLLVVIVGSEEYRDTVFDRLVESLGVLGTALTILSFVGLIMWMIAYIVLAMLAKDLRRKLTDFPVARRTDDEALLLATCQSCGGGVRFGARAFAALCNYCGVENFRADHARRERAEDETQQLETRASLFDAMTVITDFAFTFFIVMTILGLGFVLLALGAMFGSD